MAAVELSDWYELFEGRELEQGDVFEGCPVFRVPADLPYPLPAEGAEAEFGVETQDMIVMSQSCDLVEGQKGIGFVTLCPLWPLSTMAEADGFLASTYGKEMCRRGNLPGYHMLAASENADWQREVSIVSFREIHSLPVEFLRNLAEQNGDRLRLRSPYREHLAQAFARYFMRVGLPVDIPSFAVEKDEKRAIERLETLDPATRKRVIDAVEVS